MAFRKWFLAFAALAILSSFAIPASAQVNSALQCVANAGVPPTVRYEGLTELVGDLVLNCTGGTPTNWGAYVPQSNVTVFLSTNITSRIIDSGSATSEALLMIDEPHSLTNPQVPLLYCYAVGLGTVVGAGQNNCGVTGTNSGLNVYNPAYQAGRYNTFGGRQTGTNQITFFGVPIDPPGTQTSRIIRITNLRANANGAGTSSTLVPQPITAYISITGSTSVPVNNPSQVVAYVQPGLSTSRYAVSNSGYGVNPTFIQCQSINPSSAADPTKPFATATGQIGIRFSENFGTAWKIRNISELANNSNYWAQGADLNQNVPGAIYNTETGFLNNSTDPSPNPPGTNLTGAAVPTTTGSGAWNSDPITRRIGVATQGTRLMATFASVPQGVTLFVPVNVATNNSLNGGVSGQAVLVTTDANGAGALSLTSSTTSITGNVGFAPVSLVNGSGIAVYEVVSTDPYATEVLSLPVYVAYAANVGSNLPEPGKTATFTGSYAPLSNVNTASASAPIPRFVPSQTPLNLFSVVKCSCNILFPFVTNQQGYDTGIAISNTSLDTINGVTPQQGTVTIAYFGGGTPPPNAVTGLIPGGGQVLFTLSGGGTGGGVTIPATPNFQGYIIAQAQFQYCHAFAYISAQGALPTAPGASESYLGLILDKASTDSRTNQTGEVLGH